MKPHHLFVPLSLLLTALAVSDLRAEEWPSLDRYASNCVLVVKARQVGNFSDKEDSKLTFEVVETWKGRFDQRDFTGLSPEGYIQAAQGEHGVRVTAGPGDCFLLHSPQSTGRQASDTQHRISNPNWARRLRNHW
jgi:hypothetical protein